MKYFILLVLIVAFIAAVIISYVTESQQELDQITDYDVIKHIAAMYGLPEPEACGLKNNIEFRYYKANRYYTFLQDENGVWQLIGAGYIDPPPPTIEEVKWKLFILLMQLEAARRRYQERQFDPLSEKPKPWVNGGPK